MSTDGSEPQATMVSHAESLRRQLRRAGLTLRAIDAVWPEWWSADAEDSLSAVAELRYTVARRLGLAPRSLFDGPPRFVWKDEAKFKNLGAASEQELAILASFGGAVGRCAIGATSDEHALAMRMSGQDLRASILASSATVGLFELLVFCWSVGIPVLQLTLFPLSRKRMHAMTVRSVDRFAVLIGRHSRFRSQIAYILAHEIGHIVLGHVSESKVLLEMEDPLKQHDTDDEEIAADRFALEVLTGDPAPRIQADRPNFTATQLADAALRASAGSHVDPGVLALCLGHSTGRWRQAFGALKVMFPDEINVGVDVNALAQSQLDWPSLSLENRDYLATVMGATGDA